MKNKANKSAGGKPLLFLYPFCRNIFLTIVVVITTIVVVKITIVVVKITIVVVNQDNVIGRF